MGALCWEGSETVHERDQVTSAKVGHSAVLFERTTVRVYTVGALCLQGVEPAWRAVLDIHQIGSAQEGRQVAEAKASSEYSLRAGYLSMNEGKRLGQSSHRGALCSERKASEPKQDRTLPPPDTTQRVRSSPPVYSFPAVDARSSSKVPKTSLARCAMALDCGHYAYQCLPSSPGHACIAC